MKPGGRLAAAIELLDLIDADPRPADMLVRDYFRTRRYAGSKDRRSVTELVFKVLRERASIDWRLKTAELIVSNRLRAWSQVMDWQIDASPDDPHGPEPLTGDEINRLREALRLEVTAMSEAARAGLPDWLFTQVKESLPEASLEQLCENFGPRASTDLRVNSLKTDIESARAALAASGIASDRLDWVPTALRLAEPVRLEHLPLWRDGHIEVQDAGSQYVTALCGARPGERVADICAGAGGKTLGLAAAMQDRGHLFASDVDARRLRRLAERARRAGAHSIETLAVGPEEAWPDGWAGSMDGVLVDAPCSGSGTWRRQPEQRWRLTPERLHELTEIQASVLDRGARLVRPGGRLIYVTCSCLQSENETAVTEFLDRNKKFTIMSWADAAREASIPKPPTGMAQSEMLRLSPAYHGVDGFFAAVLTRTLG